jgi:hypothetical protein
MKTRAHGNSGAWELRRIGTQAHWNMGLVDKFLGTGNKIAGQYESTVHPPE